VHYSDEPLADLACVPLYHVCRLARQHVKAVLSGEGSDEILAGYNMEEAAVRLTQLRAVDRFVPRPILSLLGMVTPGRHGETLRFLGRDGWSGLLRSRASHITSEWMALDKERLWRHPPDLAPTEDVIRGWYDTPTSPDPFDQYQEVLVRSWLVEDLLMKADKMSMACSLELREPFLDHALVEWAARLPHVWKVGDRRTGPVSKRILREFCRNRLPEPILTRSKQGFPVPAYRWLAGSLGGWCSDLICGPKSRVLEFFQRPAIEAVVLRARSGDGHAARQAWVLIILELWLRRWL
jgi:asparagine synthase (glutamine-hydrolysing)